MLPFAAPITLVSVTDPLNVSFANTLNVTGSSSAVVTVSSATSATGFTVTFTVAIEGAEWAIPSHDILMGFQNVTKNYYMPDLRQPASYQEVLINKAKWDALPKDLQAIVKWAGMAEIIRMTAYSVDQDSKAIEELEKKHGVKIVRTPDDVLKAQLPAIDKVYEVEAQKNPYFAKVLKSQKDFASRAVPHAQKIRPPIEVVVAHYWKK